MLKIAYFENFKGGPTLLLAGKQEDIIGLLSLFGAWSGHRLDMQATMGGGTKVQMEGIRQLFLDQSSSDSDSVAEVKCGIGEWRVSQGWRRKIEGLLQSLLDSQQPSHQYLDSGNKQIQIICSKDEYPGLL